MTDTGTWRPIALVTGWQTAASLCYYSAFAATPFLRDTFGLSRTLIGVFVTVLTLGYTVALFPSGAAVDGLGEKPVMLGGLVALGAGALVLAASPTYAVLLVAAFALGGAYATAMPASNRGIAASVASGRLNLAMGIKQVGVTVGSGTASILVTGLGVAIAWQAGFVVVAAVAAVVTVVVAFVYAGTPGTGSWQVPDFRRLRNNGAYLLLAGTGVFLGAALFTTVGYAILYMDEAVGTSVWLAGLTLAGTQATGSVGRIVAGSVADRLPESGRGALAVLVAQTALAIVVFALLAWSTPSVPVAIVLLLGLGATILGLPGVYHSGLTALVADDEIGAATAGGQTTLNAGALLAPPAFGWLADNASYEAGWALLAGCSLVALVLLVGAWRRANGP